MDKYFEILQNQFHDITLSLERADLIQCDQNWRGNGGRPPYSSIGLIRHGTGTIIVDGEEMQPVSGQLYLLPAHTSQVFFNDGSQPYLKYFCHFNIRLHDTELFEYLHMPLCVTSQDPETVADLFEKMIAAHKENSIFSLIQEKQYLMELIGNYMQCCGEQEITLAEQSFDPAINKAIEYAQIHLDRAVSVEEMAEVAGYHPSHFTKLFLKRFGVSTARFIIQKKTRYAMDQLTNTTRTIADISNSLGFSSQFYFCSFFKKQTGMTPSQYREIYLQSRLTSQMRVTPTGGEEQTSLSGGGQSSI